MKRAARDAVGPRAFGVGLFALAFLPWIACALWFLSEPVWDGHYYDFGARRIAAGFGYSDDRTLIGQVLWHPWCHYPVGYSAVLGAAYRVFGASALVAGALNALVGALLAIVTYGLALAAFPALRWRARVAGLLVAVHPGLVLYGALVMTEPLAALLTLGAFWFFARDRRAVPIRGGALGALTLGLAALVRPQALLCAPVLGLAMAMRARSTLGQRAALAFATVVLTLAPVLPWTARNCRVMDGCALVSTNAGWNLAIGAFPRATGRFETLRASDGCRDVTGQVQQDRCWLHYGLDEIRRHPGHWLRLVPAKLGFTFDHESFAVEYLHEARPAAWPEGRRVWMRDAITLVHRLLLCAAALGCIAFPRGGGVGARTQVLLLVAVAVLIFVGADAREPTFWPLALFTATVPWLPLPGAPPRPWGERLAIALLGTTVLTHAVFFGEDRYHVVVTPVFCLLAAMALRSAGPRPAKAPEARA